MTQKTLFAAIAFLVIASSAVFAQSGKDSARPDPMKIYEDWKQKEMSGKSELPEHLALAVISQRLDSKSAQLDFALIGQTANGQMAQQLTLEIQPMLIIRNANGQAIDSQAIGSATQTNITANSNLSSPVSTTVVIPANSQADAVMVKWVLSNQGDAGQRQVLSSNTMHLLLANASNSSLMTIAKAAEK